MSSSKLALLDWVMGQVLLPEQFEAQQESILANIGARAELSGLPSDGLARLAIDEDQLAAGAVAIGRLTYVFPSGLLIDVPGNAVVSDLNLDPTLTDGVSIYLHIRTELRDATELKPYLDDPRGVRRSIYSAELSTAASHDHAYASVRLMSLTRRDDRWSLDPYVPPLLRVGRRRCLSKP